MTDENNPLANLAAMAAGHWFLPCLLVLGLLTGCTNSNTPTPTTYLKISPKKGSIELNFSLQLKATLTYPDHSTEDLTNTATWSSDNPAVATVDAGGLVTPAAGALSGQAVLITASHESLTATSTVLLLPNAPVISFYLTPQNQSIPLNGTLKLIPVGTYSDQRVKTITEIPIVWNSNNNAVAGVDSTGVVTPAIGASAGQSAVVSAQIEIGGLPSFAGAKVRLAGETFSLLTVSDPLVYQQWSLLNTGQTGFADNAGIANTSGLLGTDIHVNPVYVQDGYTGVGVTVAVIDTGLEIAHEDLSANVVPDGSWNFVNNTTDPTLPLVSLPVGDHGTSVSGLVAMARNGLGGMGVAPAARLKGFNYLSGSQNIANLVVVLGGSSAGPDSSDVSIFNQSFGTIFNGDIPIDATVEAQYASGTATLRGGKGALYVKSAGNGFVLLRWLVGGYTHDANCSKANALGTSCQNANFDPANTLPYNIVVAALNAKGIKSSYSSAGSAIWTSAPGGEYGHNAATNPSTFELFTTFDPAMVTTDQSGCQYGFGQAPATYSWFDKGGMNLSGVNFNCNYDNVMNGTSSAAPMLSGALALILEANPELTWREVKDILARTAIQVDAAIAPVNVTLGDGGNQVAEQGWVTNAAGLKFHNWYGFGALNVQAAVEMAKTYPTGSLGTFVDTGWIDSGVLALDIPDDSASGVSIALKVPSLGPGAANIVETVQLAVTTEAVLGCCSGDIGIELTSPNGTRSILKNIRDGFGQTNLSGMWLASNAFYGERGTGTWTVKVLDGLAGGTERLSNVKIRVYGH